MSAQAATVTEEAAAAWNERMQPLLWTAVNAATGEDEQLLGVDDRLQSVVLRFTASRTMDAGRLLDELRALMPGSGVRLRVHVLLDDCHVEVDVPKAYVNSLPGAAASREPTDLSRVVRALAALLLFALAVAFRRRLGIRLPRDGEL